MDFWKKATKFSAQLQIRGDQTRRPTRAQSHDHLLRGLQLHLRIKDLEHGSRAHTNTHFIDLVTRKDPGQKLALPKLSTRERPMLLRGSGLPEAHQHCSTACLPHNKRQIRGSPMFPPLHQRPLTKLRHPTPEIQCAAVTNSNFPYGDALEDDDAFWGQQKCRVTFHTDANPSFF